MNSSVIKSNSNLSNPPLNNYKTNRYLQITKMIKNNNSKQNFDYMYKSLEKERETIIGGKLEKGQNNKDFLREEFINLDILSHKSIENLTLTEEYKGISNKEKENPYRNKITHFLDNKEKEDKMCLNELEMKKNFLDYSVNKRKNHFNNIPKKFVKKKYKNYLYRSFSCANFKKRKIKNRNLSLNNYFTSFFDISSNYLIEELEPEIHFHSDFNSKSCIFLPKYSLNLNDLHRINQSCNKNSYVYNNIDNIENNCWSFNISPNNYFEVENKMNQQNDSFSNFNKVNAFVNNTSNENNKIINVDKSEETNIDKERIYKSLKENIKNIILINRYLKFI